MGSLDPSVDFLNRLGILLLPDRLSKYSPFFFYCLEDLCSWAEKPIALNP